MKAVASMKLNPFSTGLYLAAFSSAFYLVKVLPLSPVYPLIAIAIIFLMAGGRVSSRIADGFFIAIFLTFCVSAIQVVFGKYSVVVNFFLGTLLLLAMVKASGDFSYHTSKKAGNIFCWFVAVTHGVDSAYRIFNPEYISPERLSAWEAQGISFYQYKFNSLMYESSNTTAVAVLIAYLIALFVSPRFRDDWLLKVLLIVILASTFSRAAYAAFVFVNIYYFSSKRIRSLAILLAVIYIIFQIFMLDEMLVGLNDRSLQTKFDLIFRVFNFYDSGGSSLMDLLFGVGFGRAPEVIGRAAHNLILTFILEGGLLGTVFLFGLSGVFISGGKHGRTMLLMYFLIGMSYFPYAGTPFTYFGLGIAYIYDRLAENKEPKELMS